MTDKLMGGMDPAARAAAADAAAKKEGNLAENIRASVSPGSGLKPSDTAASRPRLAGNGPIGSLKKTVKDMPAIDSGMDMNAMQTRRLTLDSNASYGMKVKRPPSDESGSYKVLAAPESSVARSESSRPTGLLCQDCGETSKFGRLTCEACGAYFTSTVQETAFEKAKSKARRTQELGVVAQEEVLTWQQMMLRRLVARSIDLTIILSGFAVVMYSYLSYAQGVVAEDASLAGLFDNVTYCLFPGVLLLVLVVYSATFEASLAQATPGKIAMGIVVVDGQGKELTFSKAFARAMVTYMPVALTVVTIWFTRLLNPALESLSMDKLWYASQAVMLVGVFGCLSYFVNLFSMAGDRWMRTIFDMISSSRVKQR